MCEEYTPHPWVKCLVLCHIIHFYTSSANFTSSDVGRWQISTAQNQWANGCPFGPFFRNTAYATLNCRGIDRVKTRWSQVRPGEMTQGQVLHEAATLGAILGCYIRCYTGLLHWVLHEAATLGATLGCDVRCYMACPERSSLGDIASGPAT